MDDEAGSGARRSLSPGRKAAAALLALGVLLLGRHAVLNYLELALAAKRSRPEDPGVDPRGPGGPAGGDRRLSTAAPPTRATPGPDSELLELTPREPWHTLGWTEGGPASLPL